MARGPSSRVDRFRLSYAFLLQSEKSSTIFSVQDLVAATNWKPETIRTYLNKKWSKLVVRCPTGYICQGISSYSEDEYLRLMSQNQEVSAEPKKPVLTPEVESLVRKARESALLALQVYNCPTTSFKSEAFIVLMVIAWTSLFHASFEIRGISYIHLNKDGSPKTVDGDTKAWELGECVLRSTDTPHAVKKNLEFIIKLRNRIEHRYLPTLDPHVAGECQSLLQNFDEMLVREFGTYYAIRESLAVPLQTGNLRTGSQSEALRRLQGSHFHEVKEFVDAYRDSLGELYSDPRYSFRVYLVAKTGNVRSSSDMSLEFIHYNPDRPEEMKELQKHIALIKDRQVSVANANLLNPTQVVAQVACRLGQRFTGHHHANAWKRYKVRPRGFEPGACDTKYCVPDPRHKDYGYTAAWVELLVEKLSVPSEYEQVAHAPKLPVQ